MHQHIVFSARFHFLIKGAVPQIFQNAHHQLRVFLQKLPETDDWFAQGSKNMSYEEGKERMERLIEVLVEQMRPQKGT